MIGEEAPGCLTLASDSGGIVAIKPDEFYRTYWLAEQRGRDGLYAVVGEVRSTLRQIEGIPRALTTADLERVYPDLVPAERDDPEAGAVVRPWLGRLVIKDGIAVSGALVHLTITDARRLGVHEDEMHRIAVRNLEALDLAPVAFGSQFAGFAGGPLPLANAAHFLLPGRMRALARQLTGTTLAVALPCADLLLACRRSPALSEALSLSAQVLHGLREAPLTADTFVWLDGEWEVLKQPEA